MREAALNQLALDRHGLTAVSTAFIDDIPANVAAAATLDMAALDFTDASGYALIWSGSAGRDSCLVSGPCMVSAETPWAP